jgi:hypothetical protein
VRPRFLIRSLVSRIPKLSRILKPNRILKHNRISMFSRTRKPNHILNNNINRPASTISSTIKHEVEWSVQLLPQCITRQFQTTRDSQEFP